MTAVAYDPFEAAGRQVAPYVSTAGEYLDAGWWPVPCDAKQLLVRGVSGHAGRPVTRTDVAAWSTQFPTANVAIRLPGDVVCLDYDAYDDKPGADTMAAMAAT